MILDNIVRVLGVTVTVIMIYVMSNRDMIPDIYPTYHAVIMTVAVAIFMTQGISAYSAGFGDSFRERAPRRTLHGVLQFMAVLLMTLGVMYSFSVERLTVHNGFLVHMLAGIIVFVLAGMQVVIGIIKFRARARDGKVILRWHAQMGPVTYIASLVSMILGMTATFLDVVGSYAWCWSTVAITIVMGVLTLLNVFMGPRERRSASSQSEQTAGLLYTSS